MTADAGAMDGNRGGGDDARAPRGQVRAGTRGTHLLEDTEHDDSLDVEHVGNVSFFCNGIYREKKNREKRER